ncbi:sigma-70 family RNA polymerase sigma factor [Rhodococcus sp. KBS0724]|uniref:RNA polymerase sigma factor SigJ n=1 Tax=Rhodococcus sp. KBS0724 TaxID=1179674 RepID=UPI00110D8586|nr:RNA polymerase sigma factor SigJ [Rhodococcus sp. KBS0724]TSD40200.1 sigma-70 family RNA polymerase sigma factor [Rhodococcus sp. KBS0724]TSD40428.1 sigma-70 family RNA polymerase sigma factor [Rhodococcus sp. KBS0724]
MSTPFETPIMAEERLAGEFSAARPRLIRIAYAVVGTHAEAEDVVSDCWLRLVRANAQTRIEDVGAWTTVAVARHALDSLRSARVRREMYVGPWLPEPTVHTTSQAPQDPADRVTLDESVSFALLVVMETLSPAQRTAWVLHDLFSMPFQDVATVVGRTPAAVRQLAARARKQVAAGIPHIDIDVSSHRAVVEAFQAAAISGNVDALLTILDPQVVLTSDGGGVVSAARRPVSGADKVSRFIVGLRNKVTQLDIRIMDINGLPGLVMLHAGNVTAVVSLSVSASTISRIDILVAPTKLANVHVDA